MSQYFAHVSAFALITALSGCATSSPQGDVPAVDRDETWEVHYLNGVKTGYSVARSEIVFEDSRRLVRTTKHVTHRIRRYGEVTIQQLECESLETIDGELVNCRSSLTSGSNVTTSTLTADDDYLDITLESTESRRVSRLPWQTSWRGYFGVEQSLKKQPMQPGEQRTLHVLLPFYNQVAATRLTAQQWETTSLLNSDARLMRIVSTQRIGNSDESETLWMDDQGEIQKTESVMLGQFGQVSYRTNSDMALREEADAGFDLGFASAVALNGLDANPHEAQRAKYRVRMQRGDPSKTFAESRCQKVHGIDEHVAEVIVSAESSAGLDSRQSADIPTAEYLDASHWVQSDDPQIQNLATGLAHVGDDPWAIAIAAEAMVHQYVKQHNYKDGMATAADVARTAEGDCTEHAVLLAAICRARKIPARVAVGLVYAAGTRSFAFHMWNEVWIAHRWVALDATLGGGGIRSGHLKILDSDLADTASVADLLPVLKVLGDLEIELVEIGKQPETRQSFESNRPTERQRFDETVWAAEVQAQRYERPISRLWNALRSSDDKWAVLAEAIAPTIHIGPVRTTEELELGIRRYRFDTPNQQLTADQFRERLTELQAEGFRLVESEFHHSRFEPKTANGPRSEFSFVLHVERAKTDSSPAENEMRVIVRGIIAIRWQRPRIADGEPTAVSMEIRDMEILTRDGPPPFQLVFTYSRRKNDVASAHPIVLFDLDGNGYDEIIMSRWNRVYENRGSGLFHERRLLSHFVPHWETGAVADFSGDGAADFLTVGKHGKVILFRGDQRGRFTALGRIAAAPHFEAPLAMSIGDVDADSDLDVWLTQYRLSYLDGHMPSPYYDANDGFPAYLLLNDGNGEFIDATEAAGLTAKRRRRTYSTSLVDLDDDGDLDLLVVSDYAGLDLYENDGHGHFTDVTESAVDEKHLFGMSHTFGDYDRDGKLDFYVIGMSSTTARRLDRLKLGRDDRPEVHRMRAVMGYGNRMFISDGSRYQSPPFAEHVARTGWSWGATTFDFDNDQDPDIYVANGFRSGESSQDYCTRFWCHDLYTGTSKPDPIVKTVLADSLRDLDAGKISWNGYEHNVLLLNLAGRDFVNVGFLMGVSCEFDSRAVVSNDLDGDGRLDLLVTQYEYDGRGFILDLHTYRNTLITDNHWIGVRLRPLPNGFNPIGARVRLRAGNVDQVARVVTGDSFLSQHASQIHFGLGVATEVDMVEVRWPNGHVERIDRPAINRYHEIVPDIPR